MRQERADKPRADTYVQFCHARYDATSTMRAVPLQLAASAAERAHGVGENEPTEGTELLSERYLLLNTMQQAAPTVARVALQPSLRLCQAKGKVSAVEGKTPTLIMRLRTRGTEKVQKTRCPLVVQCTDYSWVFLTQTVTQTHVWRSKHALSGQFSAQNQHHRPYPDCHTRPHVYGGCGRCPGSRPDEAGRQHVE
jgi:hypothetical protein